MDAILVLLARQAELRYTFDLQGIIALIAGVLIFIFPKLLNYIVAAYLVIFGLVRVFNLHL
jgi:uncharacterized membrane protein HdeD (DUF308 family)